MSARALVATLSAAVLMVVSGSAAVAASASTYYVAPTGSDAATGDVSSPWRTIKKGMEALHPGDVLQVRGGTYTERATGLDLRRGTAAAPITVRAYPGERPVLRGLLSMYSADYWTLDGLNVTWDPSNTDHGAHMIRMLDGVNWRITNSEIWGSTGYSALLVGGSAKQWRVDHSFIHDTAATHDVNQDHLIYVTTPVSGGVIERNMLAGSPNGRGVKIGPASPGSQRIGGVTIRYNTFTDNTGPSNIQLSYGASDNLVYRNILVRSGSGQANVTAYNLNGDGNRVVENVGWASARVHDSAAGVSGTGNLHLDPQLEGGYPRAAAARDYGRFAGDDSQPSAPVAPAAPAAADGTPPSVRLVRPAPNQKLSGTVGLAAEASDPSGVAKVQFRIDGTVVDTDAGSYAHSLNTRRLTDGRHRVEANAFDSRGNVATATVTVTVGNRRKAAGGAAGKAKLRRASRRREVRATLSLSAANRPAYVTLRPSGRRHVRVGLAATPSGRLEIHGRTARGRRLFRAVDTGLGYEPGAYRLRVQVKRATVRVKAWRAGAAQPRSWRVVTRLG